LNDRKDKTQERDSDSRIGIKKMKRQRREDRLNKWGI
jgi:hypothetical protein